MFDPELAKSILTPETKQIKDKNHGYVTFNPNDKGKSKLRNDNDNY